MSNPSNAAKAAAILCFTSGVQGYDTALRLYDELATSDNDIDTVLDKTPGARRWHVTEGLCDADWWENVVCLALSIDASQRHFNKEQ